MFNMKTLVTFLSLATISLARIAIPKKDFGTVYRSESHTAPVTLDFYIDHICHDSQKSWPVILEVADTYGPERVRLTTHFFPLPHHRNGFTASRAARAIEHLTNTSTVYLFTKKVFDQIDVLTQSATAGQTDEQVFNIFAEIAGSVGVSESDFKTKYEDVAIRSETILEWRYGCTRGITGTPRFMVNDIQVFAPADWTLADWKKVIDPLLT